MAGPASPSSSPRPLLLAWALLGLLGVTLLGGALQTVPGSDSDGDLAISVVGPVPGGNWTAAGRAPGTTGTISQSFEWRYKDRDWRLDVTVDEAFLEHYLQKERLHYSHDYAAYVLDTSDDPWVTHLAQRLDRLYEDAGITGKDKLNGILAFVQHLPYGLDKDTIGHSEWPRYPVETLFADATDCEDTVVLYVSILRALGHDAVLLSPPRHMAAGVALDDHEGTHEVHDGKRYYYAETTGTNWRIGRLPARFDDTTIRVIPLDPQPIMARPTWTVEETNDTVRVIVSVQNVGDVPIHDVTIGARFTFASGKVWHANSCPPADLAAESALTCTVTLRQPGSGHAVRIGAWASSEEVRDRSDSRLWST